MDHPRDKTDPQRAAMEEWYRQRRGSRLRRLRRRLDRRWARLRQICRNGIGLLVFRVVPLLPHRSLGLGRLIGRLWYRLGRRKRGWALRNIDRVFGDEMSAAEQQRVVRESFEAFGMASLELIMASRWEGDYLRRSVTIEGAENWQMAAAAGKGIIAVSGHFGSWELRNSALHLHMETPVSLIAVGYANAEIDRKVRDMRGAHGVRCYRYDDRSLGYLTALRRAGAVSMLIDRGTDKVRHIEVDFLGLRARFPTGFAHMARQTGAPVLPNFMIRDTASPLRHQLLVTEPIFPDPDLEVADDIRRMTQLAVNRLEEQIRLHPGQWAWMLYPWYDDTESHGGTRRPSRREQMLAAWEAGQPWGPG